MTQVSVPQYMGDSVWPEFGLAAFSAIPVQNEIWLWHNEKGSQPVWLLKDEQLLENRRQHQKEGTLFYKEHWQETALQGVLWIPLRQ